MSTISRMNGLPLCYAILMDVPYIAPRPPFLRSSHTSLARAHSRIAEDLHSEIYPPGTRFWVVELETPRMPDPFAPVPPHRVLEGPYDRDHRPPR
jgi:hypothetical protein